MDSTNLPQGVPANGQNSSARYFLIMILLGISVTTAITSWFAPRLIMWWYDSPAQTPISAACAPAIDHAIRVLQSAQLMSLGVGAVLGLFLAIQFRKKPQSNPLNTR